MKKNNYRRETRSYGLASSVRKESLARNLHALKRAERYRDAARASVCDDPTDEALERFLSAVQRVEELKKERAALWR